jgi:DNA-binding PadR family transcriptional regulator
MTVPRRPGYATLAILKALANGYRHGFDIIDVTGLPGGTVYPALGKLETDGCVQSRWEDPRIARTEGRPPRRYYELRKAGERLLEDTLRDFRDLDRLPASPLRQARPKRA